MDHAQRAGVRYIVELALDMSLYVLLLYARRPLLHLDYGPAWKAVVLLSPVLPLWGAFWVIVRHYRRIDEYLRRELLQIVAVTAGVAACVISSYGFVKDAFGLPDISIEYAWNVMAICWLIATFVVQFRNRGRVTCTTS